MTDHEHDQAPEPGSLTDADIARWTSHLDTHAGRADPACPVCIAALGPPPDHLAAAMRLPEVSPESAAAMDQAAEQAAAGGGPEIAQDAMPRLLHSGTYALYQTPAGGLHVVYRAQIRADDAGTPQPVTDQADEHLPELPPAMLAVAMKFAQTGQRPSPLALMRELMASGGMAG